jgi:hypothetical protein
MQTYPTDQAIIAATCGATAHAAERRARLEAVSSSLHFSLMLFLLAARGRRMPITAIRTRLDAGCIAAHRAVEA